MNALLDRLPTGRVRIIAIALVVLLLAIVAVASTHGKKHASSTPTTTASTRSWFTKPIPSTWAPNHTAAVPAGRTLEAAWSLPTPAGSSTQPLVAVFAVPAPNPGASGAAQLAALRTKYESGHYDVHTIKLVDGAPAVRVVAPTTQGSAKLMVSLTYTIANGQLYLVQFQTAASAYRSEQPAVIQVVDSFSIGP